MEFNIRGIPANAVDGLWRFAEPYIKRALDHTFGELSLDDIRGFCESRDMQLWMIATGRKICGAGTTQIVTYPAFSACRIVTLAGSEFDQWMGIAHATIEEWALANGCRDIEAYCRKGFVPKLLDIGYKHRYSVAHKRLKE